MSALNKTERRKWKGDLSLLQGNPSIADTFSCRWYWCWLFLLLLLVRLANNFSAFILKKLSYRFPSRSCRLRLGKLDECKHILCYSLASVVRQTLSDCRHIQKNEGDKKWIKRGNNAKGEEKKVRKKETKKITDRIWWKWSRRYTLYYFKGTSDLCYHPIFLFETLCFLQSSFFCLSWVEYTIW